MASQILHKKGFDFNLENSTLIGFFLGLAGGLMLLLLTGGKFGVISLIIYVLASLAGIVGFAIFVNRRQKDLFAAGLMVMASLIMLFVLQVGIVINVVVVVGSSLLLIRVLTTMREGG